MKRADTFESMDRTASIADSFLFFLEEYAFHIASNCHVNSITVSPRNKWPGCADVRVKDKIWLRRCLLTLPTRKKPGLS